MKRGSSAAGWWWWCLALAVTALLLLAAYNRWLAVTAGDAGDVSLALPLPVLDRLTVNRGNSYKLLHSSSAQRHVIVVIRTYVGFLEATRALLANLDEQQGLSDARGGIAVHAIIVPTDLNSTAPLRQLVSTGAWRQALFPRLQVHFHHVDASVYTDNCCQVTEMCTAPRLQSAWAAHMARRYGHYKPANQRAKVHQACSGNNLLHYVLTDAALMYARDSILSPPSSLASPPPVADSVFIVLTNGDNSYSRSFAASMVAALEARPELDLVTCDYLERGQGLVRSALRVNQMDLGATMYRLSSLRRLGSTFLDAMPRNAWPSHYYAADAEYVLFLVRSLGARWGKVDEVLFTHW